MSRDVYHDTTKNSTHSNNHENIPLNPMTTLTHSNPTPNGAGEDSFGARDDGSTMSSSSNQYVSSPYQCASSAIAVLDTFETIREYLPEREYLSSMSIPEQQPTVAYTSDLSLGMNFLPGEDNVKLKEDITYRSSDRKVTYRGELIVTKYRLLFVTKPPDPINILVDVPLGMISQIEKIGGQTRSDGASYGIEINCKDIRDFFFGSAKEQHQRRNLYENLTRLIFPFSISKPDVKNPLQFFSSFFAWDYKKQVSPTKIDEGWTVYNKVKDYMRMGIQQNGNPHWRIDTEINKDYALCDTYPDVLVIPSNFDRSRLPHVAKFRSRNRMPVLSWYSRETCATIVRASQPLTGLYHKSQDDIDYLNEIAEANINQNSKLFILDARPKINAMANLPKGGGYEKYPDCELEFNNIQNIRVMRESLDKLHSVIRHGSQEDKTWLSDLESSDWLFHIRAVLTSALRVVSLVNSDKRSVFVHCSDGWDRTAQLTSLAMLMLDPYYRTLNGYMILVEKEWISFGHKFFLRIGYGDKNYAEQSPIFLQFLDCTYQLLQQFESSFEFNETFLLTLADYLYSCQYGTFLLNSEKTRLDMKISEYTMSVWTPILRNRQSYLNSSYNNNSDEIIQINLSSNHIKLWENYYFRYMSKYQSTSDLITRRHSTLLNLRNTFSNESPQQQSRTSSLILSGTLYQNFQSSP